MVHSVSTGAITEQCNEGTEEGSALHVILFPHSIGFSGSVCPRSSKASGSEDLEIEEPISCGDCTSFHLHPTLPSMLGTTLVGHQVVQMCEPSQERLLAAFGMMKSLHHE